jgi:integrase/recombinase XerD
MPKNLRKRGDVWWYRITKAGQTFEGSLQTGNLGVAKERLESVRRELTATRFGEKPRRTFDEAAVRFKREHFPALKHKSRLRYSVSLRVMVDHFQGVYLDEIGSAKLGDFERARLAQGVTTTTVRRDLACLSSLFSRAEEWEWITNNPVKPYKRGRAKAGLKEGPPRTRYLSETEESALEPVSPPKAWDAIAFAIDTGLRKEEQFSLELTDLDLEARELTVRAEIAKTGVERKVPLLDRAFAIAIKLSADRVGRVPLFVTKDGERYSPNSSTMYEALQKACRRAGVARCSWHDLRRTCGCRLLQVHGMSLQEVSAWLGHGDVRITQARYAFLKVDMLHKALRRPSNVVYFSRKGQNKGQFESNGE